MTIEGPRIVVVSRPTEYANLLAAHGTHEQARFFLQTRGIAIADVQARHEKQAQALAGVSRVIPRAARRAHVLRADLARFMFEPEDVVIAVGQDGLVANAAKYLGEQAVIGVNPDAGTFDGVLVKHPAKAIGDVLALVLKGRARFETRTMVQAVLDDGQKLCALNEIFVGHRTHQSARYRIALDKNAERQSSSGLIVATGTGATGWALSIRRARTCQLELPKPEDRKLAFFVREAFPSVATSVSMTEGLLEGERTLSITSEMGEGGAIFGDGLEDDRIAFGWGARVTLGLASGGLRLVIG
jgi:NAD kinase